MASNSKNQDIVELIIKGQDEYSDVSEEVRQELEELATQAGETRAQFDQLERSLDLAETYRAQEAEVSRLARAQAEAKIEVDQLTKANKETKGENIEVVEALARARAELGSYRTATNRAQKALDKTKDSMRQYGVSLEQVEQSQTEMKDSSSQLADELTELQKKQAKLVSDAREQIQASRDKALAQQQYNEALRQQSNAMADQFRSYTKQQAEQRKVKAETERLTQELRDLASQLEKGDISWEDFRRRATDAGRAADLTQKQVAGVRRSLEGLVVSSRQSNQALQEQARETKRVEQATEDYRYELERLLEKYRAGKIDIAGFEKAEAQLRRKLKLNEQQVESTRREMGAYQSELSKVPQAQAAVSSSTDRLARVTTGLAKAYGVLLAAQKALDVAMYANRAYTESEDAMLGLQKTTALTASEINGLVAEMSRLSGDVTSTTKAELLAIAEAAGRMGIEGAENISAFTKSIDALSSATGLAGDETAQAIAQILNVTGEAQSNVMGVSSVIAELGNTTATTEQEIVHFAKRLATDTKTAKLTSAEVLGIAASMAEMGMQAEGASTVIGRTFRFIEDAVKGGGKSMEDLQRITGQTEAEIQQAFGEDKVGLFTQFVSGIGRVQDGGETLNQILSDMGIQSDENARILGLMSQTYGSLTENVNTANQAFVDGNAHFEEMAKKEAALSSSMQRLQNRIKGLAEIMGEAFSDDLARGLDMAGEKSGELEDEMAELGETAADVVIQLADIIDTIGGLLEPLEVLTGGVGVLDGLLFGVSFAFDAVSVAVNSVVKATAELGYAWNKFTGDTEDMEAWAKVWDDADERINKSVQRQTDAIDRLNGNSSRAFQDLRDTYNKNREALDKMDEGQRKALETIMNSTGYIEGNDAAYRDLTRAIQRAADEKKIYAGLTKEESALVDEQIRLLKAQGVEEEEAARIAIEAAQKRRQEIEKNGEAQKKAGNDAAAAADQQTEAQKRANDAANKAAIAQSEAWKALGLDVKEVTGALTEQGKESVKAFDTIVMSGQYSAEQITLAFASALEKAKTEEDVRALEKLLQGLGTHGHIAGEQVADGMLLADQRMQQLATTASTALEKSLQNLGVDITKIKTGFSEMGRAALDEFDAIQREMENTGITGEKAAEITREAFQGALKQISTAEGLEELEAKVRQAFANKKMAADDFTKALDDIKQAYAEIEDESDKSTSRQLENLQKIWGRAKEASKAIAAMYGKNTAAVNSNTRAEEVNTKASEKGGYQKWAETRAIEANTEASEKSGYQKWVETRAIEGNSEANEENTKTLRALTGEMKAGGKTQQEWIAMGEEMGEKYKEIALQARNILNAAPEGTLLYIAAMRQANDYLSRAGKAAIQDWERKQKAIDDTTESAEKLNSQSMDGLRDEISSTREEAEQLRESLEGTVASLEQELANMRGETLKAEQIEQERKMVQLREQYEQARSSGDRKAIQAAQRALTLQQQIYREKVKQIKEEEARNAAKAEDENGSMSDQISGSTAAQRSAKSTQVENKVIRLQIETVNGELAEGDFTERNAERFLRALSEKGAVVK